ncbi:hypothetical protein ATN83_3942 [Raoultella ornithinolytica]|nr:hypothetical protein ATN83_3942 [Raoultella ornithinolytica]KDV95237.1 hypothetical protein AB00_0819 [Raoultella ornithinolytica 2-156-04_S1_C1]KDX16074.1 hypothetical protein AB28_0826 [Raoultella ornithinolytica 2-156-04_S1_C2]
MGAFANGLGSIPALTAWGLINVPPPSMPAAVFSGLSVK